MRQTRPWLRAFWNRAYRENVTGLSAMVAYNLMLAVFPFALLVLFVFGQVLKIGGVEASVLDDLQRLFPNAEQDTLTDVLNRIEDNSTTIGIAAFFGSLWIGASFWGAMDTAFCRIYHVECRGWVEQKRFSFAMLAVVLLFIAASIFMPAVEATLVSSTDRLPFGLSSIKAIDTAAAARRRDPDHLRDLLRDLLGGAEGPHALARGLARGGLRHRQRRRRQLAFPFYLSNVSSLSRFGSTVGFVLIALLWFYLLSLAILAGAVINSLRHELHETGEMPYARRGRRSRRSPAAAKRPQP